MQNLRVTLVQANQVWEDKEANFKNYNRLLNDVETDLIILPEMFQTGFSMNVNSLSEDFGSSNSIQWLQRISKEKDAAIYTSLILTAGSKTYNRGVFIKPSGEIETYDKRKTFGLAGEDQFFSAGQTETIVHYKGWNLQLQICYDLRFPEIVRNQILSNQKPAYDVILYVANWPAKRSLHWNTLLNARAIENQSFVIGVNRVGQDQKGHQYTGDSKLINPLGDEQPLTKNNEEIKTFVLEMNVLEEIREMLPFLKDR
ncbi:MAG: nitrilase-related carbon-nitrogen hydrolase [Crocinitomicaceae bacterium]